MLGAYQRLWLESVAARRDGDPVVHEAKLRSLCCLLEGFKAKHRTQPAVQQCAADLATDLFAERIACATANAPPNPRPASLDATCLIEFDEVMALPEFAAFLDTECLERDPEPPRKKPRSDGDCPAAHAAAPAPASHISPLFAALHAPPGPDPSSLASLRMLGSQPPAARDTRPNGAHVVTDRNWNGCAGPLPGGRGPDHRPELHPAAAPAPDNDAAPLPSGGGRFGLGHPRAAGQYGTALPTARTLFPTAPGAGAGFHYGAAAGAGAGPAYGTAASGTRSHRAAAVLGRDAHPGPGFSYPEAGEGDDAPATDFKTAREKLHEDEALRRTHGAPRTAPRAEDAPMAPGLRGKSLGVRRKFQAPFGKRPDAGGGSGSAPGGDHGGVLCLAAPPALYCTVPVPLGQRSVSRPSLLW